MDRSRLEAFSDGVFAVAITLLALNLTVAGPGHGISLSRQLGTHWPSFVAYLVSFFTIGIIWVNHHTLIKSVKVVDRALLYLNLVLLLFVVLIPFSTATAAEYLTANDWDSRVAMALYAGVFLGMSVGFGGVFEWTLHSEHVYQPVTPDRLWSARFRFAGGAAVYAACIGVAFLNPYVAFALMGLVAVYYMSEHPASAMPPPDK
jgi:uncharacterized membrane protein